MKDARGRVANWIAPVIGHIPIARVTHDHCRALVASLDRAVLGEQISWKTAVNVWGEVTSAFRHASESKDDALRVRAVKDNPTEGVEGPTRGESKEKPILYPSEAMALLSCERVPLYWRRMCAVAIYTGARANEIAALRAADVELAHASITIAKQVDRYNGGDKRTKTKRARIIEIEPSLLPLVRTLVSQVAPGDRLVRMPADEHRANLLRAHLRMAGVCREALFVEDDPSRDWIKFHNLRDTCLTWMALRGDPNHAIQARAGHTDYKMTDAYVATARRLPRAAVGGVFPSLPASLLAPAAPSTDAANDDAPGVMLARAAGADWSGERSPVTGSDPISPEMPGHSGEPTWRPQRDSNPESRGRRA